MINSFAEPSDSSEANSDYYSGQMVSPGGGSQASPKALSPLLYQPMDQHSFPAWLDQSAVNRLVRVFFDSTYLKTLNAMLHKTAFFDSIKTSPGEVRPLLACIVWHSSLEVYGGNKSAIREFRRLAWQSLLSMRETFWSSFPPTMDLSAMYLSAIVTAMYASWKAMGLGPAKRFHEELVRAGHHAGVPSWSFSPPPPPMTARDWINKMTCLLCWWSEAFALDGTMAMGTEGTGGHLMMDPREWLDLEFPVDTKIYVDISADAPLPLEIATLERWTARDLLGWTWLPKDSPERFLALTKLQDFDGMWQRGGVFWGTVVSMVLANCLSELVKLRQWLTDNNLGPVWELGVGMTNLSPLHLAAVSKRQDILGALSDCRMLFPPALAAAISNMDGYTFVHNQYATHWKMIVFGVAVRVFHTSEIVAKLAFTKSGHRIQVGLEAICIQVLAPPVFVNPSLAWFTCPDFVQATAHAITITRLTNTSSSHPAQNFAGLSTVPYLILHASWIHMLTLRRIIEESSTRGSEADPVVESAPFISLLQDTNTCVEFVRTSAGEGWRAMMAALDLLLKSLDGNKLDGALAEYRQFQQVPTAEDPLRAMEEIEELRGVAEA